MDIFNENEYFKEREKVGCKVYLKNENEYFNGVEKK